MALVTSASAVMGAGFENCGCFAPVGVGHGWYAAIGGDVMGTHVTSDGVNWRPCNKGIKFGLHRVAAIIGSATIANRLYCFCSTQGDGVGGSPGGTVLQGTYNVTTGLITWTTLATTTAGASAGVTDTQAPRQCGRLLALDEANDTLYVATTNGIARVTISTGTTTNARALAGEGVTGLVLDPANPQIGWATSSARLGTTTGGVWRMTNLRSGTETEVRTGGQGLNCQDLCLVDTGGTRYVFVASWADGVRRWTVSTDITTGWSNLTNNLNLGGDGPAGIDAFWNDAAAGIDLLVGIAGPTSRTNAGAVSHDGGATWINEATGWNVSWIPLGETENWWLSQDAPFMMLDQGRYDTCSVQIDPANPLRMHLVGRSGVDRTTNGGNTWRPSVRGQCATVAWTVAARPGFADQAQVGDADWTTIGSVFGFRSGMPRMNRPQTGTGMGVAYSSDGGRLMVAFGETTSGAQGEVWTTSNPAADNPTWVDEGFGNVSTAPCHGAAIGDNGSGSEVLLTVQGGNIKRKVGSGAITTVQSGVGSGNLNNHFCWPAGATGRAFVYCTTANGLYRSPDRGANWTLIHAKTNTSEYTGTIHHDPGNLDTLYYTCDNGVAGDTGLWKITNASGSITATKIGPTVSNPGPCAVNPISGVVYLAVRAEESGGQKIWVSPSNNPGGATTFVDVTDAQWAAGPFAPADMTVTANGTIIVASKQGGFYVAVEGGGAPTVVNATAAITQTITAAGTASAAVSGAPTPRTLAANTATANSAATISISPTGMVAGDWMVADLSTIGGAGTHAGPAGWTQVVLVPVQGGIGLSRWAKKAGVGEAGPYVFNSGSTGRRIDIIVSAWIDADPDAPFEQSNSISDGAATSITHAALTSSGSNRVWLLATAKGTATGATTTLDTPPAGFTEVADICTSSATGTNINMAVDYKAVGAGSTGTQQITSADNAVFRPWQGIGSLLQPVVGGGVTVVTASAVIAQTISPAATASLVDPPGPPPDPTLPGTPVPGTPFFDGIRRPRLTVTAGLGGVLDPGPAYLHLGVGPGLGTAKLAGPEAGVNNIDITADVRSISLSIRGRGSDVDAADPVTAVLVLSNRHGNYDFSNPASPYYGQLEDGAPIRVRADWAGVADDLFYGELADITLDLDLTPDATATFTCADGLEKLGRAYLPETNLTRDGDRTGTRINWLADQAAYPSSLRAIDTGYTTLGPTTLGDSAAELMRKTEATEFGLLYVDGSGTLTFYDRHRGATAARSVGVQATFGDSGSSAIGITNLQLARSRERAFNRVAITREPIPVVPATDNPTDQTPEIVEDEPVEQVADDFAAQADKGVLAFPSEVGQLSRNDFEALALAQYLVGRFSVAQNRIREIQVNALRGGWAQLLRLRPLDRVAVVRDYGPATVSAALLVQGVSQEITVNPPSWEMTFTTSSPPPTPTLFVLGTGRLGSSSIGRLGW